MLDLLQPFQLKSRLKDLAENSPSLDVSHGAVVIGNDATPTVTIAEFGTAEGVVRTEEVCVCCVFCGAVDSG